MAEIGTARFRCIGMLPAPMMHVEPGSYLQSFIYAERHEKFSGFGLGFDKNQTEAHMVFYDKKEDIDFSAHEFRSWKISCMEILYVCDVVDDVRRLVRID